MTEVLHSPGSSSLSSVPSPNPTTSSLHSHTALGDFFQGSPQIEYSPSLVADEGTNQGNEEDDGNALSLFSSPSSRDTSAAAVKGDSSENSYYDKGDNNRDRHQLSLLALLVALFRKSVIACKRRGEELALNIGSPSDVRHVAHVTFDRFNGFLGLPVEIEPEVPRRAPSASANVFGVSTESMQLSYDPWGNSVPTILLMMQTTLYAQGGLQVEGIFRINPENSQEEYVREQLNQGTVPQNIDVHCLAGLIKAWFRELPEGVLDSLSSEQVMQCQSDEDCFELVRVLPSTESALLDWAVNLMADVVQHEHLNKMNVRNIAMVFAPNMTKMADPFTALMYAVQVMNFLKTLITNALHNREDSVVDAPPSKKDHFNDNGEDSIPSNARVEDDMEADDEVFDLVLTGKEETNCEDSSDGIPDVPFSSTPGDGAVKETHESEGKSIGVPTSEIVFGQSMVDSILKKEICNGVGNRSPPLKMASEWAAARW